jgi:transposase
MKAYSIDLRERVMAAIENDSMTQEEIMEHFGVSATFIFLLKKRVEETGTVNPKPHGGGMPPKFTGKALERIRIFVEKNPDATLHEILDHTRAKASIMAVSRALDRLGFNRKKNRYGHLSKIEKM